MYLSPPSIYEDMPYQRIREDWTLLRILIATGTRRMMNLQNMTMKSVLEFPVDLLNLLLDQITHSIRIMSRILICAFPILDPSTETRETLWKYDMPVLLLLIIIAVTPMIYWHPRVSRLRFQYDVRLKHWGVYKSTQKTIHISRFVLLLIGRYACHSVMTGAMLAALVIIPVAIAASVLYVKVLPTGGWPSEKLGFTKDLSQQFIVKEVEPELARASCKKEQEELSSTQLEYDDPMDIDEEFDRQFFEEVHRSTIMQRKMQENDINDIEREVRIGLSLR
ncbi:hypothetical protein BDF14DRAFT_906024 [Spinellus fusiger]|nr:hypothetical protein BDF14DRAFT_906024 [Spinellus fusiger]